MKLNDIKKVADEKYAPFVVTVGDKDIELRVPLTLSREERAAITRAFNLDEDKDERKDMLDVYTTIWDIIIEDPDNVDLLVGALEDNLSYHQELFTAFSEQMQLGEASSSKK